MMNTRDIHLKNWSLRSSRCSFLKSWSHSNIHTTTATVEDYSICIWRFKAYSDDGWDFLFENKRFFGSENIHILLSFVYISQMLYLADSSHISHMKNSLHKNAKWPNSLPIIILERGALGMIRWNEVWNEILDYMNMYQNLQLQSNLDTS